MISGIKNNKKTIIVSVFLFVMMFIISIVSVLIMGKKYVAYVNLPANEYSDIKVHTEGNGDCSVKVLETKEREMKLLIEDAKQGNVQVIVECMHKNDPTLTDHVATGVTITKNGFIFWGPDLDFSGHAVCEGMVALYLLYLSLIIFISYRKHRKESAFLYGGILRFGLCAYFLVQGILFAGITIADIYFAGRIGAYRLLSISSLVLTVSSLLLLPLIIIFSVGMTISNIVLIKKERARFANLLGFIISGLLISGSIIIIGFVLFSPVYLTPEPDKMITVFIRTAVSSIFLYMVCNLFATEMRLLLVSKNEPSYDKDFIIILGCSIKKDGTLYPLLKGRADAAIGFYKRQLEKTSKKAIFIPSGGQGSDEVISEGVAIKNYLVECGIPEDEIIPETTSKTTFENMKFSKNIIDEKKKDAKVAFATTNYHVFRSGMIALSAGLDAEGIAGKTKWYFWPNAQVREFVGLLAGKWKTHIMMCILLVLFAIPVAYSPIILEWLFR